MTMASLTPEESPPDSPRGDTVLEVRGLSQEFAVRSPKGGLRKAHVSALAGVSFSVSKGETFALVGETGSGKSTLARAIIGEPAPKAGQIFLNGTETTTLRGPALLASRRAVQMVFQDPFTALDPRWTVEQLVCEPLQVHHAGTRREQLMRVREILSQCGLPPGRYLERYPRDLSGGECQRVAIARALAISPDLVICDEPVTALDVSIQAQILNLLAELRDRLHLTYLLIAHDLTVVKALSHRVGTMYLGKLCEVGGTATVFERPAHPYTTALLSAVPPRPGFKAPTEPIILSGEVPSPLNPPSGCRFRTRCPIAQPVCAEVVPEAQEVGRGHSVMCHFPFEIHDVVASRSTAAI